MHDAMIADVAGREGRGVDAVRDAFLKKIPMGQFRTPEDIGHAVLYLASDESRYVTGIGLVVDGGMDC
jgi:NAD(P)-dependent dehydrogenase (short-subunit alcohol dehydrogenase family)